MKLYKFVYRLKVHIVTTNHHTDLPVPEISTLVRSENVFDLLYLYYIEHLYEMSNICLIPKET